MTKRDGDSSLMQLKEEFRSYEALRREHDAQIVQVLFSYKKGLLCKAPACLAVPLSEEHLDCLEAWQQSS